MKTALPVPRKAIALGIAIALVISVCAVKLLWDLRADSWATARRGSADVAASISHDLERNFQIYNLSLQAVVDDLKTPGVMELPIDIRDRILFDRSANARYLGAILVLDSRGNVFIDSRNKVPRRESFGAWDFFKYHQQHQDEQLHIGHPVRSADGNFSITLSRRLQFADGAFAGVVVGTIEVAYFKDLFSKIDLGFDSGLSLTLDDGTMLMRFPYRDQDIGRSVKGTVVFDRIVAMQSGTFIANASIDGVQRQYTFQRVGDLPLFLTAAQATETISAGWWNQALLIGLLTTALLAGCGTLAIILGRELIRRQEIEARLFEESERLHVTLSSIGDAVLSTDVDGRITYLNPVAERMSGWTTAEAIGMPSRDVLIITTADNPERVSDPIRLALDEQQIVGLAADSVLHRRNGGLFAVEDSAAPIRDRDGAIIGAVMVFHDVSETRAMTNRMSHLAQHDALTDLPNRVLMQDRLAQAIDRGHRNKLQAAVLFLDLDRFKNINDSLGHAAGDQLLIQTALRLKGCVRESDTVSRQGGDEFVILLSDLSDQQGPSRVAEKILRKLSAPFEINGQTLTISASIGIAVYPSDGNDVNQLTKNADAAMYLAKQSGRNAYRFFTSELGDIASRRLNFEQQIADGLKNHEFILHYQPLCRSDDGRAIGAEALVRWSRNGGLIPPGDFIPIAEECGQIVELGDAILSMACRQAFEWNRDLDEPFFVAVNVSAHQFRAVGFVDRVAQTLKDTGLDPRCLELEITETALISTAERTEVILRQLKDLGVSIALDDFGTGYSSLSYLSRFPVDRIKIDKSFVHEMEGSLSSAAIVQAMIGLGHTLKLDVTAEGVESHEQARLLRAMGCEQMQGYLCGRPCAAAAFDAPTNRLVVESIEQAG